jgi:outer membrane protein insertion porin family
VAAPPAPDSIPVAPAPDEVAAPPDTTAPAAPPAQRRIGGLRVTGNIATDSLRILRSFEVTPGSRFSDDALRRGIRKLFALGLFDDVWVEKFERGDVVDVLIHVHERPRISKIEIVGAEKRETAEVERKLFLRVGEVYAPTAVQTQIDSLLKYYREEGFAQASIDAAVDTTGTPGRVGLRFNIREGEKVKITQIRFEGMSAFNESALRKQLKTKRKGFFGGGELKEEHIAEDRQKLEAYYQNRGYRDARLIERRLEPGKKPKELTLVLIIDEGPRYKLGTVTWRGNHAVETLLLQGLWIPRPGDFYDASRVEKAQGGAYAEYAEHGYLYLNIEPRETVRPDRVVDVEFVISEGQASNIRMVNIAGNRSTREKVIRREIAIHEGDRFRRSALVRTQGDIFRLGLFEDVQVDFAPADSTDVDLNLKVKEKQVGTASAGAGYTSESGLTGFIELGHNNVLGNGQSLSLHLERGGRRSDYYVSFTEPWFRDTPTLLGFSLFNTERDRDLYTEHRIGGSGRIGRPLKWPDYSRGSITYRLERVRIDKLGPMSIADSIALAGINFGTATLTSSVELQFQRNTTDNPFYPTKGSRLSLDDEFAGGPFGGSIHFHKHRIEGRVYLPSLVPSFTTMVRARVGMLGAYGDQNSAVPPYETFRLGGGTTLDPLRGYDDYQVVPSKFNYFVTSADTIDRVGPVEPDSIRITRSHVRYPGGNFMTIYTVEQQFPIFHPLRGVFFFDAGNTWHLWDEIRPLDLKIGAGIGFRMEIPLLGNIGFDYGYGFHRDDRPKARGHLLFGNVTF